MESTKSVKSVKSVKSNENAWNFIPRVYVATLQNSPRIPLVCKSLQNMGVSNYEFNFQIPPVNKTFENITLSCTDNHCQIYRKALKNNYPFICVFEDDVFTTSSSISLKDIEDYIILNKDWDIIFLGNFPWKIGKKVYKSLNDGIFWCAHSYLISRKCMEYMLKYSPEQMMKIGRLAVPAVFDMFFKEGGGIDTFIAYSVYRGFIKNVAVVPMIIEQSSMPFWSFKARLAEKASHGNWWPSRLFNILWILYWVIVLFITQKQKE